MVEILEVTDAGEGAVSVLLAGVTLPTQDEVNAAAWQPTLRDAAARAAELPAVVGWRDLAAQAAAAAAHAAAAKRAAADLRDARAAALRSPGPDTFAELKRLDRELVLADSEAKAAAETSESMAQAVADARKQALAGTLRAIAIAIGDRRAGLRAAEGEAAAALAAALDPAAHAVYDHILSHRAWLTAQNMDRSPGRLPGQAEGILRDLLTTPADPAPAADGDEPPLRLAETG